VKSFRIGRFATNTKTSSFFFFCCGFLIPYVGILCGESPPPLSSPSIPFFPTGTPAKPWDHSRVCVYEVSIFANSWWTSLCSHRFREILTLEALGLSVPYQLALGALLRRDTVLLGRVLVLSYRVRFFWLGLDRTVIHWVFFSILFQSTLYSTFGSCFPVLSWILVFLSVGYLGLLHSLVHWSWWHLSLVSAYGIICVFLLWAPWWFLEWPLIV